jgi:hypothetical protein
MANSIQTFSQGLVAQDTLRPQSFTSTGAGLAVDTSTVGTDFLSARLTVGAVNTFTSLAVKMQASTDSAFTTPVDITNATFTTVTAANTSEVIDFQMPTVASVSASPFLYVRAYATLVGTSALVQCNILGWHKMDSGDGYTNSAPTVN